MTRLSTANPFGFATFPPRLVTRTLPATCPARVCLACGAPWRPDPVRRLGALAVLGQARPCRACRARWQPGLVLDPFPGSGTAALEAVRHGGDWLGGRAERRLRRLAAARIERAGRDGHQQAQAA